MNEDKIMKTILSTCISSCFNHSDFSLFQKINQKNQTKRNRKIISLVLQRELYMCFTIPKIKPKKKQKKKKENRNRKIKVGAFVSISFS